MIPLGLLSMVAVAIIMERLWVLRRSNFLQGSTVQTLSGLLASDKFQGSIDFCRRHPGPFTGLVVALVENRHAPYEELREILEDTGRLQLMGLQRGLPALGTIVAGAPLLGLLGTVIGMIKIFAVAATAGAPPLLIVPLIAAFSNLCGCTTNYSTGPLVIYFGMGYVPTGRWFNIGFLVSLFHLVIWLGLGMLWWKFLGWW